MSQSNGAPQPSLSGDRAPRRIVLLVGDDKSAVDLVLAQYQGAEISGKRVHNDVQRFAEQHRGRRVAAEWLGPRGWVRFLWAGNGPSPSP